MAPTYTTTIHGLRWLPGGNLLADVDAGFQALAEDSDAMFGATRVGMQEGVIDAGSFEVTAGAARTVNVASNVGTGALVQDDTMTRQGLYYVPSTASLTNVAVGANSSGNPRVDRVVVSLAGVVAVVAGTATSGATLDNLTGAAAIPASTLHLADVLVANGAASLANNVIRDRRKWARGAYRSITRNSNAAAGNDYTVLSSALQYIDSANLAPRIECSGMPLRCTLRGHINNGGPFFFNPVVDGIGPNGTASVGGSIAGSVTHAVMTPGANVLTALMVAEFTPAAGSHIIAPAWAVTGSTGTLWAQAAVPLTWTVEELVRQNTANNTTTTG